MKRYNIVWNTQSNNSSESMPLGGHDAGCNVWVQDDEVCLYLAQSGAFDENGTMLKLGRLRLRADAPLSPGFSQELDLPSGSMTIRGGDISLKLWMDVTNADLHMEYDSDTAHALQLTYDNWRYFDRPVTEDERGQCRNLSTLGEPLPVPQPVTRRDTVLAQEDTLLFYHKNDDSALIFDHIIRQQGLEEDKASFPNWLKGRISGGCLHAEGFRYTGCTKGEFEHTDQMEYRYESAPVTAAHIVLSMETGQYASLDEWKRIVTEKHEKGQTFAENCAWWADFWDRSYIYIDEAHPGSPYWRMGRNYQLFRYMLGCNYYGTFPTKFNGGLFTFYEKFTPDYRNWSGTEFTAQNQRLVYWPMLRTGDFDAMKPQFDFYLNILEGGKARVKHCWGIGGAHFPEQISCFGLSNAAEYRWDRRAKVPMGEEDNPWTRLHYSTALEFALMMLQHIAYTGKDDPAYVEFAEEVVRFYMEHYPKHADGTLRIFPSTALETYKGDPYAADREKFGAEDPMDAVAGLRDVLDALLDHAKAHKKDAAQYKAWRKQCPELPTGEIDGCTVFLPAKTYNPKPFNCEMPQLYRIFPYSHKHLPESEKRIGRNTYEKWDWTEDQKLLYSWHQNGIFAARLGMTKEAMRIHLHKLGDAEKRFPAFWGPGHDWTPDHNHGGSGMIGLQEMLLQDNGDDLLLFPAWDETIDVRFKLHALSGKVVEGALLGGERTVTLH